MYVGFGSLLVDNPQGLTEVILQAAARSRQRVILSRCARAPSAVCIRQECAELPQLAYQCSML